MSCCRCTCWPASCSSAARPSRQACSRGTHRSPTERSRPVALVLHRITRVYGVLGVTVPLAGIVLAVVQGRMAEIWITLAMALTAVAGGLLTLQIYPRQRDALAEPGDGANLRQLGMLAGTYNLLWAIVVVLMIVRPGDHTGS